MITVSLLQHAPILDPHLPCTDRAEKSFLLLALSIFLFTSSFPMNGSSLMVFSPEKLGAKVAVKH